MSSHIPVILNFISTIFISGFVVVLLKYMDNKRAESRELLDDESIQRREFKEEMARVRSESSDRFAKYEETIKRFQEQLDEWKDKYYNLWEKYTELKGQYDSVMHKINKI